MHYVVEGKAYWAFFLYFFSLEFFRIAIIEFNTQYKLAKIKI